MKCIISGTFMMSYREIYEAADTFRSGGVEVLSPHNRSTPSMGRQFKKIEDADFLYVVNTNGVIGSMTKLLMGYAIAFKKPIYLSNEIEDETLRQYVKDVLRPEKLAVSLMLSRH